MEKGESKRVSRRYTFVSLDTEEKYRRIIYRDTYMVSNLRNKKCLVENEHICHSVNYEYIYVVKYTHLYRCPFKCLKFNVSVFYSRKY